MIEAGACAPDLAAAIARKEPRSSTGAVPAERAAVLDAAASAAFAQAEAETPGLIVGIRSPEGTWAKAYGIADTATGTAMATDDHVRIGSITKTFVTTVLLQLADEGALSLDDAIGDYVPGITGGATITLRQVATMTSGIGDYTSNPAWLQEYLSDTSAAWAPEDMLSFGLSMPASFAPGTEFQYANTNYVLLGLVIEEVTGQPLADAIKTRILDPLHMTHSFLAGDAALPAPYAHGYSTDMNAATGAAPITTPADVSHWNPTWAWAAGGMVSRVSDLLIWAHALGTGQGVLPADAQLERLTSFTDVSDGSYGMGVTCLNGFVGHAGGLSGYTTYVGYDTTTQTSIVALTNGANQLSSPETNPVKGIVNHMMRAIG